ncbi:hypothetical protein ACFQ1S_19330 [Kibdelosporangium lantanae]|uniref:SMODS-associating 2TM beta-strand rich effector domain-containing protein n=1 Tax=Kibdelosporangium lantanae TaxID=1497396 RepID=A0ABW3MCY8_9PSEU
MFRRLSSVLKDYVANAGVLTLVVVLAVGGTVTAVFGDTALRVATFVPASVVVLGMFIALEANRKQWRTRAERDQRLLAHYCDILQDRFTYWRIRDWDERVVVDAAGNTRQFITVRVLVESEDLDFFRIRMGCRWKQPLKYRKRVRVQVRSLEVDGLGGTRADTTTSWLHDGRLEILTHFASPIEKDELLNLSIEVDWPGKCQPLMNNEPDEFVMRFTQHIERASWTIVLPANTQVAVDPVGLRSGEDSFEVRKRVDNDGNSEVRLVARAIEPYRLFGLRLDQK